MSNLANLPDLVTVEQITKLILPMSKNGVRKWIRFGKFPKPDISGVGSKDLWFKSTLAAWLLAHGAAPAMIPGAVATV